MDTYTLPTYTVPALDHDAHMASRFGHKLDLRMRMERRIVAALCAYLDAYGFRPVNVHDGDEQTRVNTTKEVMELVFNLDEVRVRFAAGNAQPHTVLIILGNGGMGEDLIADWSFSTGDRDGFGKAMDWFVTDGIDGIVAAV